MESDQKVVSGVNTRLARVEANYESLHADVQGLKHYMEDGFTSIRRQLENITADKKPQWGVIISGVGVVVTVMVLAFTPLIYGFQMQQRDIQRHENMLDERGVLFGQIQSELPSLKEDIKRLDASLRREMSFMNKYVENNIKRLEVDVYGGSNDRLE